MTGNLILTVNGKNYTGWTGVRVTRGLELGASDFDIEVTEAWAIAPNSPPWQIALNDSCTISLNGNLVLTGYVEKYDAAYNASSHTVRVAGRSKTCDLVDCMPDVGSGQFSGYTLDKIARAIAAPFGIAVIVDAPMGAPFPAAVLDKTETAHGFLQKLCRMRSVIATDDENGNLVLTQAGSGRTTGALVEGQNIKSASCRLSCNGRFQTYVVLGQAPLSFDGQDSQLQVLGQAGDPGVSRPRRFAEHAETAVDIADSTSRAKWRALHNAGKGTEATVTVQDWFQPGGSLWLPNETAPVTSPRLQINRSLLIGKVSYLLDDKSGTRTDLTVQPQEAYTPEPLSVRAGDGTNIVWGSAGNVN